MIDPSAQIHATAIVADGASIGADCRIGPYSLIGAEVELAAGVRLDSHVVIAGDTQIGEGTRIWPFETGLQRPHATVVLAEIWPTLVDVDHVDHPVKDARQVIALADVLADRERAGTLDLWFAPAVPAAAREDVLTEEGWVLGVE